MKFIIDICDKPFKDEEGNELYRVKGFNSLVFDSNGLNKLTPLKEETEENKNVPSVEDSSEIKDELKYKLINLLNDHPAKVIEDRSLTIDKGDSFEIFDKYAEPIGVYRDPIEFSQVLEFYISSHNIGWVEFYLDGVRRYTYKNHDDFDYLNKVKIDEIVKKCKAIDNRINSMSKFLYWYIVGIVYSEVKYKPTMWDYRDDK